MRELFINRYDLTLLGVCVGLGLLLFVLFMRNDITQGAWKTFYLRSTYLMHYAAVLMYAVMIVLFVVYVPGAIVTLKTPLLQNMFAFNAYVFTTKVLVAIVDITTPLGVLAVLSFAIVLHFHRFRDRLASLQYEKWGILQNWSAATRAFNKRKDWIQRIYPELLGQFERTPVESHLQIVSVAANAAEYERKIAGFLQSEFTVPSHILASDLVSIEEYKRKNPSDPPNFTYAAKAYDAKEVGQLLQDHGLRHTSCIIDFKGSMWHTVESAPIKKKRETLESMMMSFHTALSPNGFIVVESYKRRPIKHFCNNVSCKLFGKIWYYAERSSDTVIRPHFEKSNLLQQAFTRVEVGSGIYKLAIYRKREIQDAQQEAS